MIKKILKLFISLLIWAADETYRRLIKAIIGTNVHRKGTVIYYHSVSKTERRRFAKQMDYLIEKTRPVSPEVKGGIENGIHHIAVTFDDGFTDVIENALPVVEERKIPIGIFIPTGHLGKEPGWISDQNLKKGMTVLSADSIRNISLNSLISIGSHCISHSNLLALNDEQAEDEIKNSKSDLEGIIGKEVELLSFPHGKFNEKHIKMAHSAGYKRLFSISPGTSSFEDGEYVLGRVRVDPSNWQLEFKLKVHGAYRWLSLVNELKKRIS